MPNQRHIVGNSMQRTTQGNRNLTGKPKRKERHRMLNFLGHDLVVTADEVKEFERIGRGLRCL